MKRLFLLQVLIILCAGLATGFAFTLNSKVQLHVAGIVDTTNPPIVQPKGSGPTGTTGATGATGATGKQEPKVEKLSTPGVDLISVEAAKKLYDGKAAIFIDARPKDEYLKSHIMGAMQLEKGDLDGPPPAKVSNYLPGMEVVVYCHGELCTDSENVVKRLLALNKGIGPYHIIKAGFPGWEAAKYPVDAGREVGFE